MASYAQLEECRDYLLGRIAETPQVGIVCGSGLHLLSELVEAKQVFQYHDIPHFPRTTVAGHQGELVFGRLQGVPVVMMKGRFHFYEGHSAQKVAHGARVMGMLGIKVLLVTNAAGALNPEFKVGDLMAITDHINLPGLAGNNPLVGPNEGRLGPRFPPLTDAYDQELRELLADVFTRLQYTQYFRQGVYTCVSGPSYETPAECVFLRGIGGDAVGMSTVPEVIVARHAGVKVLGISLITNIVVMPGSDIAKPSHEEVLAAVAERQPVIQELVAEFVQALQTSGILASELTAAVKASRDAAEPHAAAVRARCARQRLRTGVLATAALVALGALFLHRRR